MDGAVNGERLSGHQTLQVHGHNISSLQQLTYQYAEFQRNFCMLLNKSTTLKVPLW